MGKRSLDETPHAVVEEPEETAEHSAGNDGACPSGEASALTDIFGASATDAAEDGAAAPGGAAAVKPADPKDVFKHDERKRRKIASRDRALVVFMTGVGTAARTEAEEKAREATTVFVDNLPNDIERKEVEALFKPCCSTPAETKDMAVRIRSQVFDHKKDAKGLFKSQRLNAIKGKLADEGTCKAYVYFPTAEAYGKGLAMDGTFFMEHHVRVEPCLGGAAPFDAETSLFLGNLLLELDEEELRHFIESKGVPVCKVRLIRDKVTRKGKGFGFVSFADSKATQEAFKLINGQYLQGREVRAKRCQHRTQQRDETLRQHRTEAQRITFTEMQKLKKQQRSGSNAPRPHVKHGARSATAARGDGGQVWEGAHAKGQGEGLTRELSKLTKQWHRSAAAGAQSAVSKAKKTLEKQRRDARKAQKSQK